ncbi:uncharacterized protein F4807DRAFT_435997 [Annulohypoxylon truncatum]|uniref:uncharacterized protein n=1 Tax=Annulohypoxylon truncatum TaxID=327061 RepID=UPI002007280C|nr:uncharacterized protein F4807DRAFT_435997 [Annulohypoxylon truncatum]KAI1207186.1 hypothetical protein F4807DRAFT_435997 [Annulohypoxylon truncatum]
MSADISATDWISSVSSVVAALVGIITLFTVYIGAMQLLSQSRMYRLGLSWRSLGPWRSTAAKSTLFGLQRRVFTPNVSLKFLVKQKWKPNLTFPTGFSRSECVERGDNVQAKTTWVNFMQALNLSPSDNGLFEMQDAAELVNGIIPMHWTGHDLVGFSSILGFQSHEDCPSFISPMPLPMQWSGPLGWLQFRSSSNGCIAEFRRRMGLKDQISTNLHKQLHRLRDLPLESYALDSRLWNSIGGFSLGDKRYLYLGGADRHARPQDSEDDMPMTGTQMYDDLMAHDLPDDEIIRKLFGKKEDRPTALRRDVEKRGVGRTQRGHDGDVPDFLHSAVRDAMESSEKKQILRPCPGLLSVTVQGELAYNRGLNIEDCREYDRKYIDAEDIDHGKYPYNLGDMYMDLELLKLMKEAVLLLRPDGFYFSPAYHLYKDLIQVYQHVEKQSNKLVNIFPHLSDSSTTPLDQSQGSLFSNSTSSQGQNYGCVYFAMELCNELQQTRKGKRACFTVTDMRLMALSTTDLKDIISPTKDRDSQDLVWAFLYSPKLFDDVLELLKTAKPEQILTTRVTTKVTTEGKSLDCADLLHVGKEQEDEKQIALYEVPELGNAEFTGAQVLASLSVVLITYFWIEKRWCTDVAAYERTMPQSVLMT